MLTKTIAKTISKTKQQDLIKNIQSILSFDENHKPSVKKLIAFLKLAQKNKDYEAVPTKDLSTILINYLNEIYRVYSTAPVSADQNELSKISQKVAFLTLEMEASLGKAILEWKHPTALDLAKSFFESAKFLGFRDFWHLFSHAPNWSLDERMEIFEIIKKHPVFESKKAMNYLNRNMSSIENWEDHVKKRTYEELNKSYFSSDAFAKDVLASTEVLEKALSKEVSKPGETSKKEGSMFSEILEDIRNHPETLDEVMDPIIKYLNKPDLTLAPSALERKDTAARDQKLTSMFKEMTEILRNDPEIADPVYQWLDDSSPISENESSDKPSKDKPK